MTTSYWTRCKTCGRLDPVRPSSSDQPVNAAGQVDRKAEFGSERARSAPRGLQPAPAAPSTEKHDEHPDTIALRAWQQAFGTTQLTHARAAFEEYKARAERAEIAQVEASMRDTPVSATQRSGYERGYKYLQDRLESIGYHSWAHDMDDEVLCDAPWRPIQTAPIGEETVLLLVPTLYGKWNKSIPVAGMRMSDFWVIFNADEAVQRVEPTHWMPIPPISSGSEREGE